MTGAGRNGNVKDLEDGHCGDYYTDGMFYPHSKVRTSSVTDGLSSTLAVGERVYELRSWGKGAYFDSGSPDNKVCSFATKNVFYPVNTGPEDVGYYITDPDHSPKTVLFNDLMFGSRHPGGANFLLGDGSVRFLTEEMEFEVFQDAATRNGEELMEWEE